jgi:hypothetical protein
MADKKIIAATIQIDTGSSNQNIKEVDNNLASVNKALKTTGDTAKKTGDDVSGAGGNFSKLKGTLDNMPGPLGGVTQGISKVSDGFKALLANPIVAILAAIATVLIVLYKAFTSTAEGADKMSFVFEGAKAVLLTVRDTILGVGKAIVQFFQGDFKGAMETGSNAVSGFGDKATQSFNDAYEASKQLDDIEDGMAELDVQRAKSNAAIKASKELLNDENASYADKKKALKEVGELESKTAAEELELADKRVKALQFKNKEQIKNSTLSQAQIKEMQDAEISFYNKQEELTGKQIQLQKQNRALDKQQDAERKAIHDAELARQKEAAQKAKEYAAEQKRLADEKIKLDKLIIQQRKELEANLVAESEEARKKLNDDEAKAEADEKKRLFDNEQTRLQNKKKLADLDILNDPNSSANKIAKIDADLQLELSKLAEGDLQRQVLAKKASNDILQIKKEEGEAKEKLDDLEYERKMQNAAAIGGVVSGLSNLIGQETAVGKGIAVAAATIDTFQSASTIFRQASKNPITVANPAYPYLMAIPAVLGGLARVKQIVAVKVPNSSGGGGASVPSAGSIGTPPIAPRATSTTLDQTSINSIGNAATPVRAYVVDSDSVNNRERNERLNRAARIV